MNFKENSISEEYLELRIDKKGEDSIFLRIPKIWNDALQEWTVSIHTPKTNLLITANRKDSDRLKDSFRRMFLILFDTALYREEILSMFKPLSYWKEIYGK